MRMEVCFVHCKQVPMPQLIAHIDGYGPLTQVMTVPKHSVDYLVYDLHLIAYFA